MLAWNKSSDAPRDGCLASLLLLQSDSASDLPCLWRAITFLASRSNVTDCLYHVAITAKFGWPSRRGVEPSSSVLKLYGCAIKD